MTILRGIFDEESDAETVARRLRAGGFAATVERERLAGEDDDEGHPWAVLTDAPALMLELLVEEYDGWLDADAPSVPETPPPAARPLDLPEQPRRVKGHFRD